MNVISLNEYLSAPASAELPWFSPEAASCFDPFFSPWNKSWLLKWWAAKASRNALIKQQCLENFSLHLLWRTNVMAYMDDAGKVFLSTGLLSAGSPMTVLSVYCHELSHIRLSQTEDYPAIKALQREFRQRFREREDCELLSPIEFFAMLIARSLLASIVEYTVDICLKEKLQQLLEDLEQKLKELEAEILTLS